MSELENEIVLEDEGVEDEVEASELNDPIAEATEETSAAEEDEADEEALDDEDEEDDIEEDSL
ncbi:MAG TPA: hypothetical protein VGI33_04415 [Paenibacillus sp.]|jgi:hypothetical protein